jgi:hypothetical protein
MLTWTVIGAIGTIITTLIALVEYLRRRQHSRSMKNDSTETTQSATCYRHTTGQFERQPDGRWFEYNDKNEVIYEFEEFRRDNKFLYLVDRSRCKDGDPGRPMRMRIPISGGIASWSFKNPLVWEKFDIVEPKRESSTD